MEELKGGIVPWGEGNKVTAEYNVPLLVPLLIQEEREESEDKEKTNKQILAYTVIPQYFSALELVKPFTHPILMRKKEMF